MDMLTRGQENISENKYVYDTDNERKTFTVKLIKAKLQGRDCKVIILHDETTYQKLTQLESKYHKMYVATIVHDIRTPLNGIIGMIDLLDESIATEPYKTYLSLAKTTCRQLVFLTYDITDFSQMEAHKMKINLAPDSVEKLVDECIQLLSFQFNKKKLSLTKQVYSEIPELLYIDKNRYMQMLLNYLGNALKFTFQGGVQIILDYDHSTKMLTTSVADSGVGISDADIPKLFKMFGKLDGNASINPQGVGFGLAICERLAKAMGGKVSAKSNLQVGSTFTFDIKASETVPVTEPIRLIMASQETLVRERETMKNLNEIFYPLQVQVAHCNCPRVLHVDDNECNKFVLQKFLQLKNLIADEVLV